MPIFFLVSIRAVVVGRSLNRRMDDKAAEKLFIAPMSVIIGISVYNCVRYAAG